MGITTRWSGAVSSIGVLRARDGRIAPWREYQNGLVIAASVGSL
jgi:hypothetical protein